MDEARQRLAHDLERYAQRWPGEGDIARFGEWLRDAERPFHRETRSGHFTGSAWLVSADGERALLMLHRKLGRWLQPGGHADGDPDLAGVALREAGEETGLANLAVLPGIFDIDRHVIPTRGDEPEHWHYDVRHVVVARGSEEVVRNEESLELAWRPVADIASDPASDASLRRMATKWLERRKTR
ncbi:ADP-ribose pyrophosphatase YjhB, NUDIX family [Luteibacter sp. UNCMF331Sha3.1]|jgi:8-oxo-dGTP pyrophosphatase MutT (NUDIX family)|uniref:NUDIX hydrolase n=1 Tax=Luteibacter sp. UNCMF331Sha3.1 TaxID=1502760 RepID=UPI0004B40F9E|nr:NUDIX hydrolase [Luteibacter sp. UNCMF331Sha3.1]SEN14834.1 ADP-ribose pyrophosphatase YjhB, NUDIX family [Luteibacter sp. UNCMF331Sha3.1]